jgi:hypothetical protein
MRVEFVVRADKQQFRSPPFTVDRYSSVAFSALFVPRIKAASMFGQPISKCCIFHRDPLCSPQSSTIFTISPISQRKTVSSDGAGQVRTGKMTELDVWRSANILFKRYGGEAVFIATKLADALLDQGDVKGSSQWVRITKAITELERKGRDAARPSIEARPSHANAGQFNRNEPHWVSWALRRLPPMGSCAAGAVHHPMGCRCVERPAPKKSTLHAMRSTRRSDPDGSADHRDVYFGVLVRGFIAEGAHPFGSRGA